MKRVKGSFYVTLGWANDEKTQDFDIALEDLGLSDDATLDDIEEALWKRADDFAKSEYECGSKDIEVYTASDDAGDE